jgi:DNA repair exonuclease SbcCD ATPase subunit
MPKILLGISIVLIGASALLSFLTIGKKAAIHTELTTAQQSLSEAKGDLKKSEDALKEVKGQVNANAEELKAAREKASTAEEQVSTAKKQAADLQTQLAAATEELNKYKASGPAQTTEAPVVDDTKLKDLEARVAELQQLNQTLTTKAADAEGKAKSNEAEIAHYKGQVMARGLEGQVLAVNSAWNFVVLSIGDKQGVVTNAQMIVKRGGRMVAKIKVTSVEPSTAIADIIPGSGIRVLPGDKVVYPAGS